MTKKEYPKWIVDQAEFQGFVKAKLEAGEEKFDILFDKIEGTNGINSRIRKLETGLAVIKAKTGIIATVATAIVLAVRYLYSLFRGP